MLFRSPRPDIALNTKNIALAKRNHRLKIDTDHISVRTHASCCYLKPAARRGPEVDDADLDLALRDHTDNVNTVAFTENETGTRIQSSSYRMRAIGQKGNPLQPSMWEMNLKSYVTGPDGESPVKAGMVQIYGVAWGGTSSVKGVEVSVDGGRSWKAASLIGTVVGFIIALSGVEPDKVSGRRTTHRVAQ